MSYTTGSSGNIGKINLSMASGGSTLSALLTPCPECHAYVENLSAHKAWHDKMQRAEEVYLQMLEGAAADKLRLLLAKVAQDYEEAVAETA